MKYHIGDKFLYKGIECVVRYINNGNAWLAPIDHSDEHHVCLTLGYINEKGVDKDGNKAMTLSNRDCLAV